MSPPLFRTAVRIASGTAARSLIRSSTDFAASSGCVLQRVVHVVDVSLMMLRVMDLHRPRVNVRFQGLYAYGNAGRV